MSALICMLGASGFVGGRTLERALRNPAARLRALAHRHAVPPAAALEVVQGDAAQADSLDRLLEPGAAVVNFAYGGESGGEAMGEALAQACLRRRIRRLVHVSTCSVYGSVPGELIDEGSSCAPSTPYERTKHAVEGILERHATGRFELAILRPTAVFGPGGRNLESLALRVLRQSWPLRYLRSCLMDRRRMHAVDVECVAAAALFLVSAPLSAPVECFVVSQDDEPENDYASIEAFFARRLGAAAYPVAPLSLPLPMLRWGLRIAGRSSVEPQRRYSSAKLSARGFVRPRAFSAALEEYADWIERHART